jgi:hypothetical protein
MICFVTKMLYEVQHFCDKEKCPTMLPQAKPVFEFDTMPE